MDWLSWLSICSRILSVAWGPLDLGLVSVSKLQVRLVRVVRFTMLESLGACLIYGFMSTCKLRSDSQAQIETHLQ